MLWIRNYCLALNPAEQSEVANNVNASEATVELSEKGHELLPRVKTKDKGPANFFMNIGSYGC